MAGPPIALDNSLGAALVGLIAASMCVFRYLLVYVRDEAQQRRN